MKKIVITQYRQEHSGSTIGAWLYHYGIDFKGGTHWNYSVETTAEGMGEIMRVFREAGYEVDYIKKWELVDA
jgi:hypothetical protein